MRDSFQKQKDFELSLKYIWAGGRAGGRGQLSIPDGGNSMSKTREMRERNQDGEGGTCRG